MPVKIDEVIQKVKEQVNALELGSMLGRSAALGPWTTRLENILQSLETGNFSSNDTLLEKINALVEPDGPIDKFSMDINAQESPEIDKLFISIEKEIKDAQKQYAKSAENQPNPDTSIEPIINENDINDESYADDSDQDTSSDYGDNITQNPIDERSSEYGDIIPQNHIDANQSEKPLENTQALDEKQSEISPDNGNIIPQNPIDENQNEKPLENTQGLDEKQSEISPDNGNIIPQNHIDANQSEKPLENTQGLDQILLEQINTFIENMLQKAQTYINRNRIEDNLGKSLDAFPAFTHFLQTLGTLKQTIDDSEKHPTVEKVLDLKKSVNTEYCNIVKTGFENRIKTMNLSTSRQLENLKKISKDKTGEIAKNFAEFETTQFNRLKTIYDSLNLIMNSIDDHTLGKLEGLEKDIKLVQKDINESFRDLEQDIIEANTIIVDELYEKARVSSPIPNDTAINPDFKKFHEGAIEDLKIIYKLSTYIDEIVVTQSLNKRIKNLITIENTFTTYEDAQKKYKDFSTKQSGLDKNIENELKQMGMPQKITIDEVKNLEYAQEIDMLTTFCRAQDDAIKEMWKPHKFRILDPNLYPNAISKSQMLQREAEDRILWLKDQIKQTGETAEAKLSDKFMEYLTPPERDQSDRTCVSRYYFFNAMLAIMDKEIIPVNPYHKFPRAKTTLTEKKEGMIQESKKINSFPENFRKMQPDLSFSPINDQKMNEFEANENLIKNLRAYHNYIDGLRMIVITLVNPGRIDDVKPINTKSSKSLTETLKGILSSIQRTFSSSAKSRHTIRSANQIFSNNLDSAIKHRNNDLRHITALSSEQRLVDPIFRKIREWQDPILLSNRNILHTPGLTNLASQILSNKIPATIDQANALNCINELTAYAYYFLAHLKTISTQNPENKLLNKNISDLELKIATINQKHLQAFIENDDKKINLAWDFITTSLVPTLLEADQTAKKLDEITIAHNEKLYEQARSESNYWKEFIRQHRIIITNGLLSAHPDSLKLTHQHIEKAEDRLEYLKGIIENPGSTANIQTVERELKAYASKISLDSLEEKLSIINPDTYTTVFDEKILLNSAAYFVSQVQSQTRYDFSTLLSSPDYIFIVNQLNNADSPEKKAVLSQLKTHLNAAISQEIKLMKDASKKIKQPTPDVNIKIKTHQLREYYNDFDLVFPQLKKFATQKKRLLKILNRKREFTQQTLKKSASQGTSLLAITAITQQIPGAALIRQIDRYRDETISRVGLQSILKTNLEDFVLDTMLLFVKADRMLEDKNVPNTLKQTIRKFKEALQPDPAAGVKQGQSNLDILQSSLDDCLPLFESKTNNQLKIDILVNEIQGLYFAVDQAERLLDVLPETSKVASENILTKSSRQSNLINPFKEDKPPTKPKSNSSIFDNISFHSFGLPSFINRQQKESKNEKEMKDPNAPVVQPQQPSKGIALSDKMKNLIGGTNTKHWSIFASSNRSPHAPNPDHLMEVPYEIYKNAQARTQDPTHSIMAEIDPDKKIGQALIIDNVESTELRTAAKDALYTALSLGVGEPLTIGNSDQFFMLEIYKAMLVNGITSTQPKQGSVEAQALLAAGKALGDRYDLNTFQLKPGQKKNTTDNLYQLKPLQGKPVDNVTLVIEHHDRSKKNATHKPTR